MHIKSIVAGTTIALIAGVGSVSADELSVDRSAVNTGTLFALPAGVATPMSEAELDAVRGQGPATRQLLANSRLLVTITFILAKDDNSYQEVGG